MSPISPIKYVLSKRNKEEKESGIDIPQELKDFVTEWKDKPGSLIKMLHKVQSIYGFIPQESIHWLAKETDEYVAKIYGVVTFYHLFKTKKPGKYKIAVCMGTACYLKGATDLLREIENILGVKENESSDDGLFSLETVRCVGCCGLAPVVVIGEEVYGNLKREDLPEILAKYRSKDIENKEKEKEVINV